MRMCANADEPLAQWHRVGIRVEHTPPHATRRLSRPRRGRIPHEKRNQRVEELRHPEQPLVEFFDRGLVALHQLHQLAWRIMS